MIRHRLETNRGNAGGNSLNHNEKGDPRRHPLIARQCLRYSQTDRFDRGISRVFPEACPT